MKNVFLWIIRFYQRYISPLYPPSRKFYPCCSQYAYEAIYRFGTFKGTALAFWRLLRCNPFTRGGYDPVPEKKSKGKRT